MSVPRSRSLRHAAGVAIVGAVLWQTGLDPVLEGLRSLDMPTLLLGAALAVPATVACAWRWQLVSRGLGVGVDLGPAVASYYRSQFLNSTLPGGVIGDVHRGLRHGHAAGHAGRGLRAVAWERFAGQVVLGVIAVVVLLVLPSPVPRSVPLVVGACALGVFATAALVRRVPGAGPTTWPGRLVRAVQEDLRCALLVRRAWPGVVLASVAAVVLHLATYLVAARAVGVTATPATLLPVALLVLVAAGLPLNVAGWGPREGMAAWSFGAAGLGADQGLATAVAFGAIVLVASLPGAVILAVGAGRRGPIGARDTAGRTQVAETGRAHG